MKHLVIPLLVLIILIQACNTKSTKELLKDETPFLKALEYIELNQINEAKKLIDPQWVNQFDSLIINTIPGPVKKGKWGFSRVRGNRIYYFIYNWQPGYLMQFPNTELPIMSGRCLNNNMEIKVEWATGVEIYVNEEDRHPLATVIELTMSENAENLHPVALCDWSDPSLNASKKVIDDWQNERFGLFIHWGPCAIEAREISWSRNGSQLGRIRYGGAGVNGEYIADTHYDSLYLSFNPIHFDADSWVKMAKDAGMKYIVFVAKHHDSFCFFDSKVTNYDIMSTPYGKDICKELADACHKNNMKLGWYYSPRDWHHKDFGGDNHDKYLEFYSAQLQELLTNYGKIDILWYDCLDSPQYLWGDFPEKISRKIRKWQPDIIMNDRGGLRGDFDTPESKVGVFENRRPWESCVKLGKGWSWRGDIEPKSLEWCIKTLINTNSGNGNLLLNTGPQPDGNIAFKEIERLKEIGQWLKKYNEAIYSTRGGPFLPTDEVCSTYKEDRIFLHFIGDGREVNLPDFGNKIISSKLLNGGSVDCEFINNSWQISIFPDQNDEIDFIVELKIDGDASRIKPLKIL
jgi:alpha-L-fucosidase